MSEEITENSSENNDEGRPPADPKNKLYTVISLLIFAVLYVGWYFIKDNFVFTYALYTENLNQEQLLIIERELQAEIPEGAELQFARLHRNFDSDMLYAAFLLPEGIEENENFADEMIPYQYGNVVRDERFTVYPYADMTADYVYGDSYVCIDNPLRSCLIYKEDGNHYALFRTNEYDRSAVADSFENAVKIPLR